MTATSLLAKEEEVLALVKDGMTIGIGGFGLDRKPMSLLRALARSPVRDLTVETYAGGLDIELLVAAGKVGRVVSCHVGLDHFGLAPMFRAARESGRVQFEEWSEWTQLVAWRAAAEGVPFATLIIDPRTELLRVNPNMKTITCPFTGRDVVALKAPAIDVALLHAEAAHPCGWALARADPYLDAVLARAAKTVVLSTERLMDDRELEACQRDVHLLHSYVDALVVAPNAALPGSCLPEYLVDFEGVRAYVDGCAAGRSALELLDAARASTGTGR